LKCCADIYDDGEAQMYFDYQLPQHLSRKTSTRKKNSCPSFERSTCLLNREMRETWKWLKSSEKNTIIGPVVESA
jgi:hypothetical protein